MKKLLSILTALLISYAAFCQQLNSEKVFLFCDRNLYITGEKISFSALLMNNGKQISNVLYAELVTPGGMKVAGGKFSIRDSVVSASITIPGEVITGVYLLRAYTRYMRNFPGSFTYYRIKVVNPYRNEVMSSQADSSAAIAHDNISDSVLTINLFSDAVKPGDTLHAEIARSDGTAKLVSVSAIPDNLPDDSVLTIPAAGSEKIHYDPEIDGVFLSGTVKDSESLPAAGVRVNLSIMGEGRDFMSVSADSSGRFVFFLRGYEGHRDVFLAAEKSEKPLNILIDNDFSTAPVTINTGRFSLTGEERKAALKMARNCQVDSIFRERPIPEPDSSAADFVPFYGEPDEVIEIESYVQLPTLEEYFNGLPTLVKVRRRGAQKYFKILGTQTELSELEPLVMVDLVAIDDPEKILAIDPRDLKRIEIINAVYVKGDQLYGGIISLISRKGDFAGIELPESGLFVNYSFPEPMGKMIVPEPDLNMPDARNTVLWIPVLDIRGTKAEFSFIAPETPGKYEVVVRGVTGEGDVFTLKREFEVHQ